MSLSASPWVLNDQFDIRQNNIGSNFGILFLQDHLNCVNTYGDQW